MMDRFERIVGAEATPKPQKIRKPKAAVSARERKSEPVDTRTVREKIDARVYDPAKTVDWPGYKAKDADNKRLRDRYRKLEGELLEKFKADLIAENFVTNFPKVDACYSKAWEHGHSAGLHEVVSYFEDFCELLSPPSVAPSSPVEMDEEDIYVAFAALTTMVEDVHAVQDNLTEDQWERAQVLFQRLEAYVNKQAKAQAKKR